MTTSPGVLLAGIATGAFLVNFVIQRQRWRSRTRGLPLPPSLPTLPLIGNALDIPTSYEWEVYQNWSVKLGSDIVSANACGTTVVVLNSPKAASAVLETHSGQTSSRFTAPMSHDLMGWGYIITLMPYGEDFKARRKLFQQHVNVSDPTLHRISANELLPLFLSRLLEKPKEFHRTNVLFVAGTIYRLAYGDRTLPAIEHHIDLAKRALEPIIVAAVPGAFFVDTMPILKYVPSWFPGAGFKRKAKDWKKLANQFADEPFYRALDRLHTGVAESSFISRAYDGINEGRAPDEDSLSLMRDVSASFFGAGTETTISSLDWFYVAMAEYPEVQARAQKELDDYLKGERLPGFEDAEQLPYTSAIVKEVLRWQPVNPVGVPHLSTEDIFCDGYFIPKGSVIFPNVWVILQDEKTYPDPRAFKPERYLNPDGSRNPSAPNPNLVVFGFGRRSCPGYHMAESLLFLAAASLLSTFSITKVREFDTRNEIRLGITRGPKDFECDIKPRSKKAEELVQNVSLLL